MALRLPLPPTLFASPSPYSRNPLSISSLGFSFNVVRIGIVSSGAADIRPLKVRMAKREEELKEIRAKSPEEINDEVVDLKGELFMLRLQRSARKEFKSSEFRRMRKRVARLLTVKREREIEEGIGRRISRKLDRQWKRSVVVRPPPSLRKKQEEEKAIGEKPSS